jgi:hypothetical protein
VITVLVGVLNLVLGIAYTTYGFITISEMKRAWKTMGFSHFGMAWILMAFTCGPHHFVHGIHVLFEGRAGGSWDLAAVGIGFPAGVVFLLLRIEAWVRGRGDRFISGTPLWVQAIPTGAAAYGTAIVAWFVYSNRSLMMPRQVIPNTLLIVVYMMIGYFLTRTQLRNRSALHGWSVSGLSLSVVFPTCALMHGIYATYAAKGVYHLDWHGFVIDWLAVPAALYFLWVVRGLYKQSTRDWNRQMVDAVPDRSRVIVAMDHERSLLEAR